MKTGDEDGFIGIVKGCQKGDTNAQKQLYFQYYNYAMGVLLPYTRNREEAQEILNDSFIKVFQQIKSFKPHLSFKSWFRRILINAAIDNYRRNEKHYGSLDISYLSDLSISEDILSTLAMEDILRCVQKLSPAYRMVFNLFVMEGYSHEEIAQKLGISVGTSKSNLAKARIRMKKILLSIDPESYRQYYG